MKNPLTLAGGAAMLLALLSGCASSGSTASTSAAAPAATSAATTSTSASGGGGRYGAGSASSPGAGAALVVTVKHDKLGTVLAAGPKRLTVYLFEADHGAVSSCTGECAKVWPPVTATGTARAAGAASAADLATITRADGTRQVTYKGHPLYFYARDQDSGDAYGQGVKSFGAPWYVLAPSGAKIDNS